jgi:hypothetical protein
VGVEHRVRIDVDAVLGDQPVREARLGRAFGAAEGLPETGIVGQGRQPAQLPQVGDPPVADGAGDRAREVGVGQPEPAPGGHAVGLVAEAVGKDLGQVAHGRGTEQLRVDRGHPVGTVRPHDGQVGHADVPVRALLDQADA